MKLRTSPPAGRPLAAALLTVLAGLGSAGCAEEQPDGQLPLRPERNVTRAELGGAWPLTVEAGTLHCLGTGGEGEVYLTVGSTSYALNGRAKSAGTYAELTPIWADDPGSSGSKKSIQPLIAEGLKLCR